MHSRVEQFSRGLNTVVEKVLLVIGSAICIILFVQVVCRYAGSSLGWSEEVSRHLLVAITFLGSTAAYKRANFIGLKGIGQYFGPAGERIVLVLLQLLTLACFLTICWFGAIYTLKAWHHTSASLQIPMAFPFSVIPIAAAILTVHVVCDMERAMRRGAP